MISIAITGITVPYIYMYIYIYEICVSLCAAMLEGHLLAERKELVDYDLTDGTCLDRRTSS